MFTALYRHSGEPPRDESDAIYKLNLRLGCLSNQTITASHFIFDFPREVIGEREVFRILSEADLSEVEAELGAVQGDRDAQELLELRLCFVIAQEEDIRLIVTLVAPLLHLFIEAGSHQSGVESLLLARVDRDFSGVAVEEAYISSQWITFARVIELSGAFAPPIRSFIACNAETQFTEGYREVRNHW